MISVIFNTVEHSHYCESNRKKGREVAAVVAKRRGHGSSSVIVPDLLHNRRPCFTTTSTLTEIIFTPA